MARATILFVDDDEAILNALRRTFRRTDYRLFFSTRPDDAFVLLKNEKVDVVVSDNSMPGMTGLDFLKTVSQRYPEAVRIMLTGQASSEATSAAIRKGEIYRCLPKPWDAEDMQVALQSACEQLSKKNEGAIEAVAR